MNLIIHYDSNLEAELRAEKFTSLRVLTGVLDVSETSFVNRREMPVVEPSLQKVIYHKSNSYCLHKGLNLGFSFKSRENLSFTPIRKSDIDLLQENEIFNQLVESKILNLIESNTNSSSIEIRDLSDYLFRIFLSECEDYYVLAHYYYNCTETDEITGRKRSIQSKMSKMMALSSSAITKSQELDRHIKTHHLRNSREDVLHV